MLRLTVSIIEHTSLMQESEWSQEEEETESLNGPLFGPYGQKLLDLLQALRKRITSAGA